MFSTYQSISVYFLDSVQFYQILYIFDITVCCNSFRYKNYCENYVELEKQTGLLVFRSVFKFDSFTKFTFNLDWHKIISI